jgi:hypothetical protein
VLKTLIIATVLLPTIVLAQQSQQLPQPRQPLVAVLISKAASQAGEQRSFYDRNGHFTGASTRK